MSFLFGTPKPPAQTSVPEPPNLDLIRKQQEKAMQRSGLSSTIFTKTLGVSQDKNAKTLLGE